MERNSDKTQHIKSDEQLMQRGKEITQMTFQAMSHELQKSMKEGGVEQAIAYGYINALPITERLANEHNAIIKRTTLKFRNSKNAPTREEVEILHEFQAHFEAGQALRPRIERTNKQNMFYAPIVMQDLCLKCHGPKSGIEAYDQILLKYPDDLAIGYITGDLRGMWSVVLPPLKH